MEPNDFRFLDRDNGKKKHELFSFNILYFTNLFVFAQLFVFLKISKKNDLQQENSTDGHATEELSASFLLIKKCYNTISDRKIISYLTTD